MKNVLITAALVSVATICKCQTQSQSQNQNGYYQVEINTANTSSQGQSNVSGQQAAQLAGQAAMETQQTGQPAQVQNQYGQGQALPVTPQAAPTAGPTPPQSEK